VKAQESRLLREALQRVTEACRRLISLRYFDGLSYKEMACQTGEKEATLRVKLHRCLSSLGQIYSEVACRKEGAS